MAQNNVGRKLKEGLDYFPFNTDTPSDRKIRRLVRKFGPKGFGVYTYLLFYIYRDKGYYLEWSDDICQDIADDFLRTIDEKEVMEIINECITHNLFDKKLFKDKSILTSAGVQSRYLEIKKRAKVKIEPDILLVEEESEPEPTQPSKAPKDTSSKKPEPHPKQNFPPVDLVLIHKNLTDNGKAIMMYSRDFGLSLERVKQLLDEYVERAKAEEYEFEDANHFKNAFRKYLEKHKPRASKQKIKRI